MATHNKPFVVLQLDNNENILMFGGHGKLALNLGMMVITAKAVAQACLTPL
jgi:hypothetical protein